MRWIGWLLLVLLGVGWLHADVRPAESSPTGLQQYPWRRTRDGWERKSWPVVDLPGRRPSLHPGVVGLLELLLSVTALVAFPARGRESQRRTAMPGRTPRRPGVGTPRGQMPHNLPASHPPAR